MTAPDQGGPITLSAAQIAVLSDGFRGVLLQPDDAGYHEARRLWNGAIDRRPALIAQPVDAEDVAAVVRFAQANRLAASVRGGGHNVAGNALCDGVVIDLCHMREVTIDAAARSVHVQGGATWAEVDAATQPHASVVPGGVMSETGVGGLTLGGGLGWLRRALGLSSDQVRAFEVVTGSGDLVEASASEHPDLYWALRGGGGGFGVVTDFAFDLHPLESDVMFAQVFYPASAGMDVLRSYRSFAEQAPDEVTSSVIFGLVPPVEPFPPAFHGQPFVLLAAMYAGDALVGEEVLMPLRSVAQVPAIVDLSGTRPYVQVQKAFDANYPAGRHYYWKSSFLKAIPDEALEQALAFAADSVSPLSAVAFWQLGGAIGQMDAASSAYAHRDATYLLGVEANWDEEDAHAREANIAWARRCVAAFRPFATGGTYLNLPGFEEDVAEPSSTQGEDLERLRRVKQQYDPAGVLQFR